MKITVLAIMLLASFTSLCWAEAQTEFEEGFKTALEVTATLDADIEDFGTEVGLTKVDFSATYLCFIFDYGLSSYRWDDVNSRLPFGNGSDDPWGELHKFVFGLRYKKPFNAYYSFFARARGLSAFEEEMNDSFGYDIAGGLIYEPSPEWELRLGALISYDEVDEFEAFPVVTILWNQEAQAGWSAILGLPQSCLKYKFTPDVSSKVTFSFAQDLYYRLADDSIVEEKGYLKDENMVVGLHLDIVTSENSLFSISGQYNFEREFAVYDKNGSDKSSHDIDGAFGGALKLSYSF